MLKFFAIFLSVALTSCASGSLSRAHYIDQGSDVDGNITGPFRWQEQGPLELLEMLQSGGPSKDRRFKVTDFRVSGKHHGWVRAEDIPALIALLDSQEPCQPVVSSVVSMLQYEFSTVGHEAAYLIQGFRQGVYPVAAVSLRWKLNSDEQRQFDEWCRRFIDHYKKAKAATKHRHA